MFAPQTVRRSARSVGLRTDASSRFEKGLPREVTLAAADRAVQLLQELCGAKFEGRWCHERQEAPRPALSLRSDALHNLLGPVVDAHGNESDLPDAEIEQILTALGCSLSPDDEGWQVQVPPSRAMDLQREVDLIEEVARLVGYDRFASHLPDPIEPGGLSDEQQMIVETVRTFVEREIFPHEEEVDDLDHRQRHGLGGFLRKVRLTQELPGGRDDAPEPHQAHPGRENHAPHHGKNQ